MPIGVASVSKTLFFFFLPLFLRRGRREAFSPFEKTHTHTHTHGSPLLVCQISITVIRICTLSPGLSFFARFRTAGYTHTHTQVNQLFHNRPVGGEDECKMHRIGRCDQRTKRGIKLNLWRPSPRYRIVPSIITSRVCSMCTGPMKGGTSSQFISTSQCNGPNGPHRKESSSSDLQSGSINDGSPNEGGEARERGRI